jgi:electron transfer flavoprotein alpha subunit
MSLELWVWIEHDGATPRRVSLEVLGKASQLGTAVAVVLGHGASDVARQAARVASRVIVVDDPSLGRYRADSYAAALAELVGQQSPAALLAGATFDGRELAPRVAARLDAAFVGDAIDLAPDGQGSIAARHAVLGGKAYAWRRPRAGQMAVITVRPNSFPLPPIHEPAPVEAASVTLPSPRGTMIEVRTGGSARPELTEAEVVVAGGRGMASPEGFRLVESLADALGGAVGASRAVVDAGWRPHADQVGKSGKTVSPRLYVALGISGAVHHVMGMDTAKVVVAINRDPAAPIFKAADYGLVGDVLQVVPALVERLKR